MLAVPLHQTGKQGPLATDDTQNAIVHNVIVDAAVELNVTPFSLDTLAVKVDRVHIRKEATPQAFRSSGAVFQSVRGSGERGVIGYARYRATARRKAFSKAANSKGFCRIGPPCRDCGRMLSP